MDDTVRGIAGATWFHVGIIVEHLESAMDTYHNLVGCAWAPIIEARHELIGPRLAVADIRATFSVHAPHYELVEHRSGTIWSLAAQPLHHLGFWVDDLQKSGEVLLQCGARFEGSGRRVGTQRFGYSFYSLNGVRLELCYRGYFAHWRRWIEARPPVGESMHERPGGNQQDKGVCR
jgi:hypothetical protein